MGIKNNAIIFQTVKCGCGEYLEIFDDESIICLQCHSQVNLHPQTEVKHLHTKSDKHSETQVEQLHQQTFNPFELLLNVICTVVGVVGYFVWGITSFVLALGWELLKIGLSLIFAVISVVGMFGLLAICGFVIFKIIF